MGKFHRGKKFSLSIPRSTSDEVVEYLNKQENVSASIMGLIQEALEKRKEIISIEERVWKLEELFKNVVEKKLEEQAPEEDIDKLIEQMKDTGAKLSHDLTSLEDDFPD